MANSLMAKCIFAAEMEDAVKKPENRNDDGSINWDFVDADVYPTMSIWFPGEEYVTTFDELADKIEETL